MALRKKIFEVIDPIVDKHVSMAMEACESELTSDEVKMALSALGVGNCRFRIYPKTKIELIWYERR